MRYPLSLSQWFKSILRAATHSSAGQSLVELALAFPLFLLLLVSVVEFGRLTYFKTEVVNAARAGAAYGSQNHITAADTTGIETAATNDALNLSSLLTASPAPTYFCACSQTPGTHVSCSTVSTACSPDNGVLFVQVDTSATVHTLFNYPGIPATFTLRGQAIMAVEQ